MASAPPDSPQFQANSNSPPSEVMSDEYESLTSAEVLTKLQEAWCNELLAPELLDHKIDIVECVMEQVKEMEENLSHVSGEDFVAGVHKLELERIRYVLCSYLRTRLKKIEANVIYTLEEEASRVVSTDSKLSPEELVYAKEFADGMEGHMKSLVLQHMPSSFQKLDHKKAATQPSLDTFVFATAEERVDSFPLDDEGTVVDLEPWTQLLAPYKPLATLVQSGILKLI